MNQKRTRAQVEQIAPLTDSIVQLMLKPDEYVDYQAGQYLQILSAEEALSYSIANAPLGSHQYELHIRHHRENPHNKKLFADVKQNGEVMLLLPFGECSMSHLKADRPILFIAGGTGFAPVKAMIEHLLAQDDPRHFELFWGARTRSDLYLDEKVIHWQSHVARFSYYALLSDEARESLPALVLKKHLHDLDQWQVVMSGPFDMVYATRDELVKRGASEADMHSDAFNFEEKGKSTP